MLVIPGAMVAGGEDSIDLRKQFMCFQAPKSLWARRGKRISRPIGESNCSLTTGKVSCQALILKLAANGNGGGDG